MEMKRKGKEFDATCSMQYAVYQHCEYGCEELFAWKMRSASIVAATGVAGRAAR